MKVKNNIHTNTLCVLLIQLYCTYNIRSLIYKLATKPFNNTLPKQKNVFYLSKILQGDPLKVELNEGYIAIFGVPSDKIS